LWDVRAEVAPRDVSPRIKDPEYRRRLFEADFRWAKAITGDAEYDRRSKKFDDNARRLVEDRTLDNMLEQLRLGRAVWEREAELLAAAGVFEVHPDGFTAQMFVDGNLSIFVRPNLAFLDDADQQVLLTAAGLRHEFIEAPKLETTHATCSRCRVELVVANGAKRVVCRPCGVITELATRAFECGRCGAQVPVHDAGDPTCESCGVRWAY
jgi:ribosomal protein S27AE